MAAVPSKVDLKLPAAGGAYTSLMALQGYVIAPEAVLESSFDGQNWHEIEIKAPSKPGGIPPFRAIVNTFLLPNGENTVRMRARSAGGEVLATAERLFQVDNTDELALAVRETMAPPGRTRLILKEPLDSADFPYDRCSIKPWFDKPDAHDRVAEIVRKYSVSENLIPRLHDFIDRGTLVLEGFIPFELIDEVNAEIQRRIDKGDHDPQVRIRGLHLQSEPTYQLMTHPRVMAVLEALFESPAVACQSLAFLYGSQQRIHQDTIHLTSFPEGYMCGVWIPLEDVQPGAGPVFFHGGSHRLPVLYAKDLGVKLEEKGLDKTSELPWENYHRTLDAQVANGNSERMTYLGKKGDVLIWHSNLVHGGSPREDQQLTRRSIVFHCFARGCANYYDTWGGLGHRHDPRTRTHQY